MKPGALEPFAVLAPAEESVVNLQKYSNSKNRRLYTKFVIIPALAGAIATISISLFLNDLHDPNNHGFLSNWEAIGYLIWLPAWKIFGLLGIQHFLVGNGPNLGLLPLLAVALVNALICSTLGIITAFFLRKWRFVP